MMGWIFAWRASLIAKEPTEVDPPYTNSGVGSVAGVHGADSRRFLNRPTRAVPAASLEND